MKGEDMYILVANQTASLPKNARLEKVVSYIDGKPVFFVYSGG